MQQLMISTMEGIMLLTITKQDHKLDIYNIHFAIDTYIYIYILKLSTFSCAMIKETGV